MVKPSASRGWPLAAQPGCVTVSTRSNAFSERCATEHGRRGEPRVTGESCWSRSRAGSKSGGAADLTADQRCIQPVESGSKTSVSAGQWAYGGLRGLEPPASSLSAIMCLPLCNPAFLQVTRDRKGRSNALSAAGIESQQPGCAGSIIQELALWLKQRQPPAEVRRWDEGKGSLHNLMAGLDDERP
jgi:hypothetical protein